MVNPRKVHSVAPGLIPIFDQTGRANRGHALETAVRVELERRRMQVTYVKTKEGYEVDFLARAPGKPPVLIQVAADLDDPTTREREIRTLLAAQVEHPRESLHLVTLAPESATGIPDSVQVHPAWSWFLAIPAREVSKDCVRNIRFAAYVKLPSRSTAAKQRGCLGMTLIGISE